ncbi:MAG: hypothetical protein JKX73_09565 [Flavobacteriales bacterium]|nr:hypothetical protein [Flavobacteriales bacterium]
MLRKNIFSLIFFLLLASLSQAQSPKWQVYNSDNSDSPEDRLKSITMDKKQNIWLGTAGDGGVKFDGENWYVYNESTSGIPNNHVDSIAIDLNGNIWFGTGAGICMFDGDTTWTSYNSENSGLPNDDIYPLAIDRGRGASALNSDQISVWVGTYGDGIVKFDGKETWEIYKSANSPLIDDLIRSIAIDKHGNKWIGTLFGGIAKFNGDATWTVYTDFNSQLPSNAVYPIVFDDKDNVWIGTEGGLAVLSPEEKWTVYKTDDSGLPDNKVYCMQIDKNGIVWIGTVGGGLARFDPTIIGDSIDPWTVYNTFNSGLPNNEVRGITIDHKGVLWLATYGGGMARFDPNGNGWENTAWDDLDGFDPYKEGAWYIDDLVGMVKKYDQVTDEQKKVIETQLEDYIKIHPSDVSALVSYAEIGLKNDKDLDKLHGYLDKAIEIESDNAEAHFWKARLHGIKENVASGDDISFDFRNYEQAIKYLKSAISLDKENIEYKETLALYLSADRRFEEARIFTKLAGEGKLPVYELLKDLQMFPLPREVIFLPAETKNMITVIKDNGALGDFPILRVHVFALNMSAEALETFYEERLPEFKLFELTRDKKAKVSTYGQYLKIWDKEMYTVNDVSDIPQTPGEGIKLDVTNIYRKADSIDPDWISELFKISPTLAERKAFCKIVYVNYR